MVNQLKLSELNELIRDRLIEAFPGSLWVVAEISELKINRNGHCYLELIEHEDEEIIARARATIWSYTFRMLKPYFETSTGQPFSQGIKVLVNVTVEFHLVYGLSLNIKDIDPAYTLGDLARQRNEIIKRLKQEGIFDMNRELPLPLVPQRIAVISSSSAAGYLDFIDQLENNYGKFQFFVTLFEATMQGDVAVPSILNAFDRIFQTENQFDMVAIIRGGGAVADLSCFDNYELAFTVTQFSLPVITGIGHEKDDTIVDMVAHTRLKTPTAVAEFLIRGVQRFLNHLNEKGNAVMQRASEITGHEELRINRLINRFGRTGSNYISMKSDQVSQLISKFHRSVKEYTFRNSLVLNGFRHSILHQTEIFIRNIRNAAGLQSQKLRIFINGLMIRKNDQLIREEENLKLLISELISREKARQKALNRTLLILKPENILNRGFTLTFHEGRIIKKMKNLETGDEIVTRFSDGMVHSEISKKIES